MALRDVLDVVARFPRRRRDDADRADGLRQSDRGDGHRRRSPSARRTPASTACWSSTIRPRKPREFATLLDAHGIAPIFLLAPTTPESRIAAVARLARGYVYYVSLKGVTGAAHLDTGDVARKLAEIRRHVQLPVGVGFGIRDAASAQAIAAHADAVVIGSRIIQEIEAGPPAEAAIARGRLACEHPQGARLRCRRARGMTLDWEGR